MFLRRRTGSALVLLLSLLCAGCSNLRKGPFVIGLYAVSQKQLPDVAAEGFDLVAGPASHDYLTTAKNSDLKVLASGPGLISGPGLSPAEIGTLDKHAGLWAWYLIDEPDLHNISPSQVRRANQRLKRSARKPTLIVLSSGSAVEKYADCSDYLAVDWYPVPWAPLATFSREMKLARLGARDKPFYAVIQAFSWEAFPEMIRTDKKLREPTYEELRCMAYLALIQGARGLFFYSYSEPRWQLKDHPTLWTGVEQLVVDLRQAAPIFENRIRWWPLETSHKGQDMFNELYDARMAVSLFEVKKKKNDIAEGFYFVVANTAAEELEFSFQIPFPNSGDVPLFRSEGHTETENDWVRKKYAGYEVAIFGPVRALKRPDFLK